ncbi:MAG: HD-GYP domain-containing protein [bacterium]
MPDEATVQIPSQKLKSIGLDIYVGLVVLAAVAGIFLSWNQSYLTQISIAAFIVWVSLVVIADLTPIVLPRGEAVLSVGGAIDFGIILLFPTFVAALTGIASGFISSVVRRVESRRVIFNMGMNALTIMAASEVVRVLGGKIGVLNPAQLVDWPLSRMFLSYFFAAIVYFLVNTGLTSIAISLSTGSDVLSVWRTNYMWTIVSTLAIAPIGFILAAVYHVLSDSPVIAILGLMIFILPVIVIKNSYKWFTSVNETYFSAIRALISALDASHHYTQGHSRRVSTNAVRVARSIRLSEDEIENIERGAILHDIGKIGLDKSILDKEGPLNSLEWAQMKQHPVLGSRIIKDLAFLQDAREIILHHHERMDGRGYPAGLPGDAIPIGARIVNVVDALDALTSNRSYRPAMSAEEAIEILRTNSGKQFDPEVVDAVDRLAKRGELIFQRAVSYTDDDGEILFTGHELLDALQSSRGK